MMIFITKSQFLLEHNRLAPSNLQATPELLNRFQQEKKPLLIDSNWNINLRMPFISWMLSLPASSFEKKKRTRKSTKSEYVPYPETIH